MGTTPPEQKGPEEPIPALPLGTLRRMREPYYISAMASWIMPLVLVGIWVVVPHFGGSQLDHTLTGLEHFGFFVGFLVGVISLVGSIRRGGSVPSAIIGVVLNAMFMFSLPG